MNADNTVVKKACEHWGLGEVTVTLVATRENHVFRVESDKGEFALRLHRQGYRSVDEIRSELMWMNMLKSHNTPVPQSISTLDGDSIQVVDDVVVDMLSWVEGKSLSQLTPTVQMYQQTGVLLARMHELADAWPLPDSFERPTWNLVGDTPLWGKFWQNPHLTTTQQSTLQSFRAHALATLDALQQADYGLIHADLVPDNILYNGHELQPIDFDDGGFGYRLFDLATITHRCKRHSNADELAHAVVAGYQQQRPLDVELLSFFEALRACTYVGWNITRIQEADGIERNQRFITEALSAISRYDESTHTAEKH